MKRSGLFSAICLVAAALITACTQDEGMEQSTPLPDGEYPLQIGGITLSAQLEQGEASPQTRVSENDNGNGSVFDNNDIIKVCIGNNYDNVGDYQLTVDEDGSITDITTVMPVYWQNTTPAIINAWYTTANESTPNTVMLNAQDENGLAYVLQGTSGTQVSYNNPATLTFTHQLAKVQVKLEGNRASAVTSVEVYGSTSCTYTNGNVTSGTQQDWLPMYHDTDNNAWEANLVPGSIQTADDGSFIRLNGSTTVAISGLNTLEGGAMHTLTVDVKPYPDGATQITGSTGGISGDGDYYIEGSLGSTVNITGGSPHIYLYDANISVTGGNAINITGGNPTIQVVGENNTVTSNNNSGIGLSNGASVTIEGTSTDDKLTVSGGAQGSMVNATAGAGIGSTIDGTGGNITIRNVTIDATGGSNSTGAGGAGIGSSSSGHIGNITINNAVLTNVEGGIYSPAIGIGGNLTGGDRRMGNITITNSVITKAKGGGAAAVIGFPYTYGAQYTIYAGSIRITGNNATWNDLFSALELSQTSSGRISTYKVGKGYYESSGSWTPAFNNADGTGTWEGVTITTSDRQEQYSADGFAQ